MKGRGCRTGQRSAPDSRSSSLPLRCALRRAPASSPNAAAAGAPGSGGGGGDGLHLLSSIMAVGEGASGNFPPSPFPLPPAYAAAWQHKMQGAAAVQGAVKAVSSELECSFFYNRVSGCGCRYACRCVGWWWWWCVCVGGGTEHMLGLCPALHCLPLTRLPAARPGPSPPRFPCWAG